MSNFQTALLKSFELQQGGKRENPQELTKVSDWGERKQPTPL
ncbi:addiction module toxin RelE [Buttiauxella izardii]|uniref:Addiction module toxin RelE n=1 Tax=Buttiauxella izardii TaxID=82991 RepID=A0A3A5JSZ6_9ENTR|nr:addiction module toxin RelE [Buttiauxella izardii]